MRRKTPVLIDPHLTYSATGVAADWNHLPTEIVMIINNFIRKMDYDDHWGWARAISQNSRPAGHIGTAGPAASWPARRVMPVSPMLRRSAEWMWALRIFQLQYEITEQPWTWDRMGPWVMSNMPRALLKAIKTKEECISDIIELRHCARRRVGRLCGFVIGHIKPSVVHIYNEQQNS